MSIETVTTNTMDREQAENFIGNGIAIGASAVLTFAFALNPSVLGGVVLAAVLGFLVVTLTLWGKSK